MQHRRERLKDACRVMEAVPVDTVYVQCPIALLQDLIYTVHIAPVVRVVPNIIALTAAVDALAALDDC